MHFTKNRAPISSKNETQPELKKIPGTGAKARLTALTELSTGDEVARADLELRGPGDLGGTRQHGAEDERLYLTAGVTSPWLERIEADARAIAKADPTLAAEEHRVLGSLVARFGHAIAVREEAG